MLDIQFENLDVEIPQIDDAKFKAGMLHFLNGVIRFAYASMILHAPTGESHRLSDAIDYEDAEITPFGFSGNVGVEEIPPSKPGESPYYPYFVAEGTGVFGPRHRPITPLHGNVMVFDYNGRTIATPMVQGQEAQPFDEEAVEDTNRYIELRKHEIAAIIDAALSK